MSQLASTSKWNKGRIPNAPVLLPDGWRVARLISISKLESGHTPSKRKPEYWNGDIGWVSLHDTKLLEEFRLRTTSVKITKLGLDNSSARLLPRGTVVFSRTATVGKSAIIDRPMATSQDFANFVCGSTLHNLFLVYLFRYMEPVWKRLMAGSIHNTIYMPVFRQLEIPLPPVNEQIAIADALSDVDGLIESLQRLITKKRRIKQGAMQELLTGRRRLPGFEVEPGFKVSEVGSIPVDWNLSTIGNLIEFTGGSQPDKNVFSSTLQPGFVRLIQIRDYKTDRFKTYVPLHLARRFCTKQDIMIGRYGPPIFQILQGIEGAYNVALIKATPAEDLHNRYALHFLKQEKLFIFIDKLSQRSSGQTGVDLGQLRSFPMPLPSLEEQEAIANTLSAMDDEIEALEKKLEKARKIKNGMMQELLTGRTRLPPFGNPVDASTQDGSVVVDDASATP